MADRQRGVFVGTRRQGFIHEQVPRHGADGVEYVLVLYARLAQTHHEAIAYALRRHALANHRFRLQAQPWGHAGFSSAALRPPTQLATFSSAW